MIKPKRTKPEHIKCAHCNKAIHINDLGCVAKEGMYHKQCLFKIYFQDPFGFITKAEVRCKKQIMETKTK